MDKPKKPLTDRIIEAVFDNITIVNGNESTFPTVDPESWKKLDTELKKIIREAD